MECRTLKPFLFVHGRTAHDGLLDKIDQLYALHKASEPLAATCGSKILPLSDPMPKFHNRKDFPAITVWTAAEWSVHPLNKKKVSQDVSLFSIPAIRTDHGNNRASMYYLQDSQGRPVMESRGIHDMHDSSWVIRTAPYSRYGTQKLE